MSPITVMGATGRTGHALALRLLDAGIEVRALGRDSGRLASLAARGAQTCVANADDADALERAFEGADAAYLMLPHDPQDEDVVGTQQRQGEAIARAVRRSRLRRAVVLSSLGVEADGDIGLLAPLRAQEARLRDVGTLEVVFLRPGYYMDDYLAVLPSIRQHGVLADSLDPGCAMPLVATGDVAAAAYRLLQRGGEAEPWWEGRDGVDASVLELPGPATRTPRELAAVLGAALGISSLPYVQLPPAALAQTLIEHGMSAAMADGLVALNRAVDEGRVRAHGLPTGLGTSFEAFAREQLVPAWARCVSHG